MRHNLPTVLYGLALLIGIPVMLPLGAAAQNVGIGTTNPQAQLHVAGKAQVTELQVTDNAANGRILESDASGNAKWVAPGSVFSDDQTLSLSSQTLSIANGNSVDLSGLKEDKYWDRNSGNSTTYLANSADNVGIGTTSPSARLEVNGTIEAANLNDQNSTNFFDGSGSDGQTLTSIGANGNLNFTAIDGAGLVSEGNDINVTSNNNKAEVSLENTIDIQQATFSPFIHSSDNSFILGQNSSDESDLIISMADDDDDEIIHRFDHYNKGQRDVLTLRYEQAWFAGGTNVGIGTGSPSTNLDVDGNIRIRGGGPSSGHVLTSSNNGTATWTNPANLNDNDWTRNGSNTHLANSGDNVGIGTASPDNKLDVAGDIRLNDNTLHLRGGADVNHGLRWAGSTQKFAGVNPDGPALYGYSGGVLGTTQFGEALAVSWNNDNNVGIQTASPAVELDVNGDARTQQMHYVGGYAYTGDISSDFGPNTGQDGQDHEVTCDPGHAMIFFGAIATDRLDGAMRCQCVELPVLGSNSTWRSSSLPSGVDDGDHICECNNNEVITGVRIYSSDRLDDNLRVRCTDLNGATTTSDARSVLGAPYPNENEGDDDKLHWSRCFIGTYATGLTIYASDRLERDLYFDCAGLQPN